MNTLKYLLRTLPHWLAKFHLLEMSLDGGFAANFTYCFPDPVEKLFLMCSAGTTPKSQLRWDQQCPGSGYLGMPVMEAMAKTLPLGFALSSINPLVD